jgi:HEAT repeat protein/tetratricopeptide (TPR) repeat protein
MAPKFTRQADRVLQRARAEALRVGLQCFGADSLLLGLLGERRCPASGALAALGLDLRRARQDLEARVGDPVYRRQRPFSVPFAPIAWQQCFAAAKAHGQPCVNTAHILVGVLHEPASAAVQILGAQGLSTQTLREALRAAAAQDAAAEGGEANASGRKPRGWLRQMRDPRSEVRLLAATQLSLSLTTARGDPGVSAAEAVPVLIDLLHDPNETVRAAAAGALERFGPAARAAAPALGAALADKASVRAAAAKALAQIEPKDAALAESLARGLEDPSPDVRVASAKALWTARQEAGRALPVLLAALTEAHADVRRQAAEALATLGPAAGAAVPALIIAVQDPDEPVRLHALGALLKIGAQARAAVPAVIALLRDPSLLVNAAAGAALMVLAEHAAESLPELLALLGDPDSRLRSLAGSVLGQLRPPGAPTVAALRLALRDPVPLVRCSAGEALCRLEQREGLVPVFVELLASSDVLAATCAATQLGKLGITVLEVLAPLRAALKSDHVQVRSAAAAALIQVNEPADPLLPLITAGLADESVEAQMTSLTALNDLGPRAQAAVPALLEMYHRCDDVMKDRVSRALRAIDPDLCLQADEPILAPAQGAGGGATGQEDRSGAAEALADWSEAIHLDPDDLQAFRIRARLHEQLNDWPSAVADWTEVIRLAPEDAQARLHRGDALRRLSEFERAASDFTFVIERQPSNAEAYNGRAVVLKHQGHLERALADYSEAIRLSPQRAAFYFNRSLAAKALRDYAQAQADLEVVLRLNPEHAAGHNNLAWFRATCPEAGFRNGAQAVAHARRACELSGWGKALYLQTLAAAHAEAGQFEEAVRSSRKALEHRDRLTAAQVEEFTGHLRLFEQGKPVRIK